MDNIAERLSPLERTIFPLIKDNISLKELMKKGSLQEVEVTRALQWLENKGLISTRKESREIVDIDTNGRNALENGLPEKRFLKAISNRELRLSEIKEKADLNDEEVNVSLGILKRNSCILLGEKIKITDSGKKYLDSNEIEKFLAGLPIKKKEADINIYNELRGRKSMINDNPEKSVTCNLTKLGAEIQKLKFNDELIESLNTNILKSKEWMNKKFRRYDLKANAPRIYPGKKHFVNEALDYAKRIWLDMGFKEMKGNMIQSSFWNFDALYTSQDHSVREMHDTFYLDGKSDLPNKDIIDRVRKAHENGGDTGSKGWRYKWKEEEARRLVLRTHTTVLSAQTLASLKKDDLPAKFFAVGRCFRNETLDFSHLFEFNQTEGIVVDENANFKHLLGYLKEFFKKMGFPKARFRPAYFPYTELSIEIDVYHPVHKKWIELGGAGIFRPEVVKPLLGIDIPVLAWGPGIDRIITDAYKIKDIRELYRNDLKQLRESKIWMK